jgi:uncharacterized small protein (DUF1192 family)
MIAELERRIAALSAEIRDYPTPLARRDEQLAALLEERARLMARLDGMTRDGHCGPQARWTNDGGTHAT